MNEIIEEYFMSPRNIGVLENPDLQVNVGNPVCGDTIIMGVNIKDGKISEILFKAYGCSTSIATASLISEFLKTKSAEDLKILSREQVAEMLGELEPKERHCIDMGLELINQTKEKLEKFS